MENLKSSQIPQGQAADGVPTVAQESKGVYQLSNATTNAPKLPTPLPTALPTKPTSPPSLLGKRKSQEANTTAHEYIPETVKLQNSKKPRGRKPIAHDKYMEESNKKIKTWSDDLKNKKPKRNFAVDEITELEEPTTTAPDGCW